MRFHIDEDNGASIIGWVVPDNPSAISRVAVSVDGRRVTEIAAHNVSPTIKEWGWHSTGQCVFAVTEAVVPDLTAYRDLRLYDVDTNVLLHNRAEPEGGAQNKLFVLELQPEANATLNGLLFQHFRLAYSDLDALPEETITFILNYLYSKSVFTTGRLRFARYEDWFIRSSSTLAVMIGDPFEDLARRLLWLRALSEVTRAEGQAWRRSGLEALLDFVDGLPLDDAVALRKAFRRIDLDSYIALSNPVTRQLTCKLPDEPAYFSHYTAALEVLARFDVVGHRAYWKAFVETLAVKIDVPLDVPDLPPPSPAERALAERLSAVKPVRDLLALDIRLEAAVRSAVADQWDA